MRLLGCHTCRPIQQRPDKSLRILPHHVPNVFLIIVCLGSFGCDGWLTLIDDLLNDRADVAFVGLTVCGCFIRIEAWRIHSNEFKFATFRTLAHGVESRHESSTLFRLLAGHPSNAEL